MKRRLFLQQAFLTSIASLIFNKAHALPRTQSQLMLIEENLVETGVNYGDLPSLNSPTYISVGDAAMGMDNTDIMFVFAFPEEPNQVYIAPQKIMVWHEVLNEIIQGNGYTLTYSPISGSLAFFSSKVRNTNLIFDSNGMLYNNNSVLIDRNTGSLWSQLLGMAFKGDLLGLGLKILPVYWTNWRLAKSAFPDAKVVSTPKSTSTRIYGRDPYGSFTSTNTYYQDERIVYPLSKFDNRMKSKTLIYAIEENNAIIAIDINYIREKKVVNFYLGPTALVAFYDPALDVIHIYDRQFWQDKDPALFLFRNNQIIDLHTRSTWNPLGKCTAGNLQNATLKELFGIYSFWFAFAAMNPETFTVPGDSVVPDSALEIGI